MRSALLTDGRAYPPASYGVLMDAVASSHSKGRLSVTERFEVLTEDGSKLGVVRQIQGGWMLFPFVQWGISRKQWPTPEDAASKFLKAFADRGAWLKEKSE